MHLLSPILAGCFFGAISELDYECRESLMKYIWGCRCDPTPKGLRNMEPISRKDYSLLYITVLDWDCSGVFCGDIFKQWAKFKGWATRLWLTGQTRVTQCALMSCSSFTCWASSSCLTQMTNIKVLAGVASEYIVVFKQFFVPVRFKIYLHSVALHHVIIHSPSPHFYHLFGEFSQCLVIVGTIKSCLTKWCSLKNVKILIKLMFETGVSQHCTSLTIQQPNCNSSQSKCD